MKRKIFCIICISAMLIFASALCAAASDTVIDESDASVKVSGDGEVKYYRSLEDAWDESGHYGDFDVQPLKM